MIRVHNILKYKKKKSFYALWPENKSLRRFIKTEQCKTKLTFERISVDNIVFFTQMFIRRNICKTFFEK